MWKSALFLALLVFGLGTVIGRLNRGRQDLATKLGVKIQIENDSREFGWTPEQYANQLQEINKAICSILKSEEPFHSKLSNLQELLAESILFEGIKLPEAGQLQGLTLDQYDVAVVFFYASRAEWTAEKEIPVEVERLGNLASASDPLPYANYALGLFCESMDIQKAALAYQREIEYHDLNAARERLIALYLGSGQFKQIEKLYGDSKFSPYITPWIRQQIAVSKMNWPELVRTLIPAAYENSSPGMVTLALTSGIIWSIILLRFNGGLTIAAKPVQLLIPSLILGALSAHATSLFFFWQERQLGFNMPRELPGQLAYCLSIGLREEGLKLLFILPLLPLLWRRSDLEIITVAGLVGLGFAMEENINYFERTAGLCAVARFATANFLHISLTAMGGLTLVRACTHRGHILQAVQTFATIVVLHGLYDAFLIVNIFSDFSWLSMSLFVFLGHQYFSWLRHFRERWMDNISATSIFTLGLVFVAGLSYTLYAWQLGVKLAFQGIASEIIGIGIILMLFFREIPETLDD